MNSDKPKALLKIYGGIGDTLMALPTIKLLAEKYIIEVALRDPSRSDIGEWTESILQYNPYISRMYRYDTWVKQSFGSNNFRKYDAVKIYNPFPYDQETFCKSLIHRMEFAANLMGVNNTNRLDIDIFLTDNENLEAHEELKNIKNPVIIQPTTLRYPWANNQGKVIPIDVYKKLLIDFPDITFIGIGTTKGLLGDMVELNGYNNYISFQDKTSIRSAIALLKYSKTYIVPDSFLGHAGAGLDKKGIVIFGSTSPHVFGHDNNINLWHAPSCAPCRLQSEPEELFECCIREGIPVKYDELKDSFTKLLTEVL